VALRFDVSVRPVVVRYTWPITKTTSRKAPATCRPAIAWRLSTLSASMPLPCGYRKNRYRSPDRTTTGTIRTFSSKYVSFWRGLSLLTTVFRVGCGAPRKRPTT
jgi:hypothetical protein